MFAREPFSGVVECECLGLAPAPPVQVLPSFDKALFSSRKVLCFEGSLEILPLVPHPVPPDAAALLEVLGHEGIGLSCCCHHVSNISQSTKYSLRRPKHKALAPGTSHLVIRRCQYRGLMPVAAESADTRISNCSRSDVPFTRGAACCFEGGLHAGAASASAARKPRGAATCVVSKNENCAGSTDRLGVRLLFRRLRGVPDRGKAAFNRMICVQHRQVLVKFVGHMGCLAFREPKSPYGKILSRWNHL